MNEITTKRALVALVALVRDRPGVLEEIVSIFRRRGFNLESLTVGHSERPGLSRMTIVVETKKGRKQELEQTRKQLEKLIPVVEVFDIIGKTAATQEMVLITVKVGVGLRRDQLLRLLNTYSGARLVRATPRLVGIGAIGESEEVAKFIESLKSSKFKIQELVRSGLAALRMFKSGGMN